MKLLSPVITLTLLASNALGTALQDHADKWRKSLEYGHKLDGPSPVAPPKLQKRDSAFLTEKTKPFEVNGTAIPEVLFDIGESYAGLLPISDHPDETRKLFFWFFPGPDEDARSRLTVWFNGGPGCSSMHGLLTEFGPFTWQDGTAAPVYNPYTWASSLAMFTNLTNMLFVEQPVGVGFTQGVPNITNEVELGQQYIGFHRQFVETFDLRGRDMYIAGESYAGMFVSYVADAFVLANNTQYYNLKGVSINDGLIGDRVIQQNAAISPYVDYFDNLIPLNDTYREQMHAAHEACGFADYIDKYLRFPPPQEPFELPAQLQNKSLACDMYDDVLAAILMVNPCFKVWHITETCPTKSEQLGKVFPTDYEPPGALIYFNRSDVQTQLNVPPTDWAQCALINVFGGPSDNMTAMDTSIEPGRDGVLTRVIEHTNNMFIGSGDLDYILATNSTLLAVQNITWNGLRGLQETPQYPLYAPYHPEYSLGAPAGAGILGAWGSERGLTFWHVRLAGHEVPGYASGAMYRIMEVMFGKVANLSVVGDFTTQSGGNYGNDAGARDEL